MIIGKIEFMDVIEKYKKYCGLPYEHLGNDVIKGIDCVNLALHIIKEETGVTRDYTTKTFCNLEGNWYNKADSHKFNPLNNFKDKANGWVSVDKNKLKEYDVIIMTIGASNVPNHCALYLGQNKMLMILEGKTSYIATYGNSYKQYTNMCFRCKEFMNN